MISLSTGPYAGKESTARPERQDRKSTRLNSSHGYISYAVFCLKKKILYDRNPQKFIENIFLARPEDYHSETQRIYESLRYPSRVTLPMMHENQNRDRERPDTAQ